MTTGASSASTRGGTRGGTSRCTGHVIVGNPGNTHLINYRHLRLLLLLEPTERPDLPARVAPELSFAGDW